MSGLQTHPTYKTTRISEQNVDQFSVTVSQITVNLVTHVYYLTDTLSYKSGQSYMSAFKVSARAGVSSET